MEKVYLLIAVPGTGKTYVASQVADKFHYIAHDHCFSHPSYPTPPATVKDPEWPKGAKSTHVETLVEAAKTSKKPIITECPFGERELKETLESEGIKVVPVFIVEDPEIIAGRYLKRTGKPLPKNSYSRASSIVFRARDWNAKYGTSTEILTYLRGLVFV